MAKEAYKLLYSATGLVTESRRKAQLQDLRDNGLPPQIAEVSEFLISGRLSHEDDEQVASKVEGIRKGLAAKNGHAKVFPSPSPGSSDHIKTTNARPSVGDEQHFGYAQLTGGTSISPTWGQAMYLLGKITGISTAIELGSCVGISGAYIASVPTLERFYTIEGSEDLASIAASTIGAINSEAKVIHGLFDHVLDELLPTLEDVDFVWIDGHHESVATIHYFERLIPTLKEGALVLFDDIYWSQDMLDGWTFLSGYTGFSHTIDMGKLGAGIWMGGDIKPKKWDVREIIRAKRAVGKPQESIQS